jgi:polysaccharide pyruvyl transferase WcaK-like protein
MTKKSALILNYTGNVYHWGCYGTSTELYLTLSEMGYVVNYLDVRTMRCIKPLPEKESIYDKTFHSKYFSENPIIKNSIDTSDIIVVNGEGTMHHYSDGQANILFLMYYCATVLKKPVHLINHSFFPGGNDRLSSQFDSVYMEVAKTLTSIVPREKMSLSILNRMGVKAIQGFDCLPRFMDRNKTPKPNKIPKTLSVSGGVSMKEKESKDVALAIKPFSNDRDVFFVTGAKQFPSSEDPKIYQWMKEIIPSLIWSEAKSYDEWVHCISSSECFVSGRYHHTICAARNQVPLVCFPSNTPKIDSSCEMFGINPPIKYSDPTFIEKTTNEIDLAINDKSPIVDSSTMTAILNLCKNNFVCIPNTV